MKVPVWLVPSLLVPFAFAAPSVPAQAPEQNEDEPQIAARDTPQQDASLSEDELETFADIYVELEQTLSKYEAEISTVETEEEARDVQVRLQQESYEKIEQHGWTPEKYNRVIQTVNADPMLLERALALIEERS